MIRCYSDDTKQGAFSCKVKKEATCVEVCQGYETSPGGNEAGSLCANQGPHHRHHPNTNPNPNQGPDLRSSTGQAVLDATFTRVGKVCYPGCTDPGHSKGHIKADGFYAKGGNDHSGPYIAQETWCREEASGY